MRKSLQLLLQCVEEPSHSGSKALVPAARSGDTSIQRQMNLLKGLLEKLGAFMPDGSMVQALYNKGPSFKRSQHLCLKQVMYKEKALIFPAILKM